MKNIKIFLLIVLVFIISVNFFRQINPKFGDYEQSKIISVIDGDTVLTATGEKVRVIGINTPELSCNELLSKDAKNFAEEKLLNKVVFLEKDEQLVDKYGRKLRYIWLDIPKNVDFKSVSTMNYSGLALESGLARTYTFNPNNKYKIFFDDIQRESKKRLKGMWQYSDNGTTRGNKQ